VNFDSLSIASISFAASDCSEGITWLYVFSVKLICEWPRISITTRGFTP